jgi:hypothetical protein
MGNKPPMMDIVTTKMHNPPKKFPVPPTSHITTVMQQTELKQLCSSVRNRTLTLTRGRMTLGVEAIFWFISHTLPQYHALQGVGDTYL